jgi:hypothetical protein
MESGGHRGDQCTAFVRHQADTQSDRTRIVEQVALAVLDGPSSILFFFITYLGGLACNTEVFKSL